MCLAAHLVLLQASAAVREFETKEDVRVFLLPHKVGASGLTLNRGRHPALRSCSACAMVSPLPTDLVSVLCEHDYIFRMVLRDGNVSACARTCFH